MSWLDASKVTICQFARLDLLLQKLRSAAAYVGEAVAVRAQARKSGEDEAWMGRATNSYRKRCTTA